MAHPRYGKNDPHVSVIRINNLRYFIANIYSLFFDLGEQVENIYCFNFFIYCFNLFLNLAMENS
jgi:hypothetical protein